MRATIIRTNGRVEDFVVHDYRDIQNAVGGLFCAVLQQDGYTLYGNDEAKIASVGETIGMPLNLSAMLLVSHVMECDLQDLVTLHGDFIMVGEDGEERDVAELNQEHTALAERFCMWQEPQMSITTL